jgi:hypothetical protein
MRATWIYLVLLLAGGFIALGCDTADDDDDAADDDDDTGDDDTVAAEAMISGDVGREVSTCPPNQDGIGALCMFLLQTCGDMDSVIASSELADADMSWPTNTVAFEIEGIPDGTWQLWGYLDDDGSGCDGEPTYGDFYLEGACVEVVVTDQEDVTGILVTFDSKCPAG